MLRKLLEGKSFFKSLLNAIPDPVFVVDKDARIVEFNEAAVNITEMKPLHAIHKPPGDLLYCINAFHRDEGCGRTFHCRECKIREAVTRAFAGQRTIRQRTRLESMRKGESLHMYFSITTSPFQYESELYVLLILEDISELVELKSIMPICAHCKKIRDDQDFWDSVEGYMKKHHDLDFSHGVCPECMESLYPRYDSLNVADDKGEVSP